MNFNVLNYVVTIYEEKSFTKAAEKLFISQPSLSQSINNLENELGTRLFDRKKGVSLPFFLVPTISFSVSWR